MTVQICSKISVLLLCVAMAGCATSRSEIKLPNPAEPTPSTEAASGRTAVIRSVEDERVFEEAPRDPGTPSLGFGGAAEASAKIKARAIGRKRNSYGKALGDVLLQPGQTVKSVIRENLTVALRQAGYQVENAGTVDPSALIVDVRIRKFWAWLQPGFWAITLNADIATDLELSGVGSPTTIRVHSEESSQFVTDSAWVEIVAKALGEYRAKATSNARDALNKSRHQ